VAEQALCLLGYLTVNSDVRAAELWATLGAAGRAAVIAAATNPAQPAAAEEALSLLANLAANSDVRAAELWATLGAAERAAVVAAATNHAQSAVAALRLLTHLTADSDDRLAEIWATLGAAGRAAVIAAATDPELAEGALFLLANLAISDVIAAELWATLGPAGRAAVVTAATDPVQPEVTEQALRLLANLTVNSDAGAAELWATLGAAGRAAVVTAATDPAQPEVAEQALSVLNNLTAGSNIRAAELWATLGAAGRAAVIAAATNPAQPAVAEEALLLLGHLTASSDATAAQLWATLGAADRAALVNAASNPAQPEVAEQALDLLIHLTANSDLRKAELWATLGAAGHEGFIIAATTAEEPKAARSAIKLLGIWQGNPYTNVVIWPLLQPRLAQLWAVTQQQVVARTANRFLFEQIRGDAHKTSQALNALNAAIPAISMHHAIATLRGWSKQVKGGRGGPRRFGHVLVRRHEPDRLALLTGIVQAKISPQKMAMLMAAAMNGIGLRQHPQETREALFNQLLAIPLAEGIDPTLWRQHMRLGLDAACSSTSEVLDSQVLSAPEKLKLLEIIYISSEVMTGQATHEELLKVRLMPNTSRDFKVKAIGLLLNHGQASSTQFKEILAWLKGEFATDTHTVFTNPATLGDIGDEAIYALTEQRQQYLSLYQNFGPHMTRDFIQEEIAHINLRVTAEEMPRDFGETLIFQLRQILPPAVISTAVKDDRQYDRKSESK
jgi:hypothetical protein